MSTLYTPLIFTIKPPKTTIKPHTFLPSSFSNPKLRKFPNFSVQSSNDPEKATGIEPDNDKSDDKTTGFVDEWGEKSELESEPVTKLTDSDPPKYEDEWGNNGSPAVDVSGGEDEKLLELKRCFVDTVYGTDFGFRASSEVRAEALELVSQLEAANPTPAPTECPELLDGNWILVGSIGNNLSTPWGGFTAFSELLPLLAAGSIPLVKVEKISQGIDTSNFTIENSTTLSSPVATLSFSATATFEVRSPSRIQVEFKEGNFKPPEIKSNIELPENVDVFGQKISLSPVQQSLSPLENAVAGIARTISGQPPLKIQIPGERTKSWLLTTYLDKDLRISKGDGGLFVLVKEGSSLLY
uniref:Plastoglobulin-1, chloroplastic isoform X1 n=1 Tax=Nicotiana tabacum TaxID=4097 RepID=A0A1S3XU23_TOBAC|nr:PREDICTED: plastoglobulin-1, chloroplastic-like isoform X1 [Nicotiana tabacum]XP_016443442.1 PREDICTED: plastoglobulin-1, chloroplastic-like isoform X1 [Nicotiana tabacum]